MQGPFRPTSFRWVEGVTESTIIPITKLGHHEQIRSSSTKFRYFKIQKASLTSKHFPNTNYEKIQNLVEISKRTYETCDILHINMVIHWTSETNQYHCLTKGTSSHFNSFRISDLRWNKWSKPHVFFSLKKSTKQISLKMSEFPKLFIISRDNRTIARRRQRRRPTTTTPTAHTTCCGSCCCCCCCCFRTEESNRKGKNRCIDLGKLQKFTSRNCTHKPTCTCRICIAYPTKISTKINTIYTLQTVWQQIPSLIHLNMLSSGMSWDITKHRLFGHLSFKGLHWRRWCSCLYLEPNMHWLYISRMTWVLGYLCFWLSCINFVTSTLVFWKIQIYVAKVYPVSTNDT